MSIVTFVPRPVFLIVDDHPSFVRSLVDQAKAAGAQVYGMIAPTFTLYGAPRSLSQADAVQKANVIFLNHRLSGTTGDRWLVEWNRCSFDFTRKRVIGISATPQDYVDEQIPGTLAKILSAITKIKAGQPQPAKA